MIGPYRLARGLARRAVSIPRSVYKRLIAVPPYETQIYAAMVRSGDVCYDIGAHSGVVSLTLARLAGPKGRVYSFEPSPGAYPRLCATAQASSVPIYPFPFGLSDADEPRELYLPDAPGEAELASLTRLPSAGPGKICTCDFYRLDTAVAANRLPRPNVIKIDVEGAEKFVLDGATELMSNGPLPNFLIEVFAPWERAFGYGPMEIFNRLARYGYQVLFACPEGLVEHDITDESPFPKSYAHGYNIVALPPNSTRCKTVSRLLAERRPRLGYMPGAPVLNLIA
jgi:FkbM family methyltransferase